MAGLMAGLSASSSSGGSSQVSVGLSGSSQISVGPSSQEDGSSSRVTNIVQHQRRNTHHQLTPVGELDPATGLFYNPNHIPEDIRRPESQDEAQG